MLGRLRFFVRDRQPENHHRAAPSVFRLPQSGWFIRLSHGVAPPCPRFNPLNCHCPLFKRGQSVFRLPQCGVIL
ncbi:hypothetical protein [Kingella oralis]|uniref:hypothetical protein n=1 Tax=Kingella oralis TaxID=505 RepID=UPI0034E58FC2